MIEIVWKLYKFGYGKPSFQLKKVYFLTEPKKSRQVKFHSQQMEIQQLVAGAKLDPRQTSLIVIWTPPFLPCAEPTFIPIQLEPSRYMYH